MRKKLSVILALLGMSTPVIGEEFDLSPEQTRRVLHEGKVISSGIVVQEQGVSVKEIYAREYFSLTFIYWEGEVYQCRFWRGYKPYREEQIPPRASCYGPARIE